MPDVAIGLDDVPVYQGGPEAVATALIPFLYGCLTVMGLWGTLLAQAGVFGFGSASRGSRIERLVVVVLACLGTVIAVCEIVTIRDVFVTRFGSPYLLSHSYTSIAVFVQIFADALVTSTCQAVYAVRAYRMTGRSKIFGAALASVFSLVLVSGLLKAGYCAQTSGCDLADHIVAAIGGPTMTAGQWARERKIVQTRAYACRLGADLADYAASAVMDISTCLGVLIPLLCAKSGFNRRCAQPGVTVAHPAAPTRSFIASSTSPSAARH